MTTATRRTAPAKAAVCVLLAAQAALAQRVVAVGDVHGAYDELVAILREAGLIDKDLAWTGGKTILVQTGDVLDRGPRSRDALDLLMNLMEKAPAQGGEVRPLLGNHEVMVMIGDLRYVIADDYRSFAGPDSEKLRETEWEDYQKYRKQRASRLRKATADDKEAWLKAHPPGYFELRQAYGPQGKYGRWLRARDAITQAGEAVFLHGGLSPDSPLKSVREINETVRKEIARMDDLRNRLVARGLLWRHMNMDEAQAEARTEWEAIQAGTLMPDQDLQNMLFNLLSLSKWNIIASTGPLWYRGYAQEDEAVFAPQIDKILKRFKVRWVVVGHTISTSKRITPRFDGRVFMIDTGMLASYFQGRASALEMNQGSFKAIYAGEPAQALAANGAAK